MTPQNDPKNAPKNENFSKKWIPRLGPFFDFWGHQGPLEGARTLKKRVSERVPQKSVENLFQEVDLQF